MGMREEVEAISAVCSNKDIHVMYENNVDIMFNISIRISDKIGRNEQPSYLPIKILKWILKNASKYVINL